MNIKDVHTRELGPYLCNDWLQAIARERENNILSCKTCCSFPHKFNKDLDEYINDNCITYASKIHGQFTIDTSTRKIIC